MNFAALKLLMASDTANAGKTPQQVAAWANAPITVKQPINLRALIVYLLKSGKWGGIEKAASDATHAAQAESRAFMVVMNNPNFSDLDLSDPAVVQMLLNIKAAGLLNNADQTAILALENASVTRAANIGLEHVFPGHVEYARAN